MNTLLVVSVLQLGLQAPRGPPVRRRPRGVANDVARVGAERGLRLLGLLQVEVAPRDADLRRRGVGQPAVGERGERGVDRVRKFSRGGILAQGATLAKQSGASRTSPILRGNWVVETLLGVGFGNGRAGRCGSEWGRDQSGKHGDGAK